MKVKYYGHSAFGITTDKAVKIIVDPYQSGAFGGAMSYGKITDKADIVLTSHEHEDHNHIGDIKGDFVHIKKAGTQTAKDVTIKAIPSHHDSSGGAERGNNLIFVIEVDGLTAAHLGDLGHTLAADTLREIGKIDVLFLPVGGFYTLDALEATKVMNDLKPAVTIPMHFKTDKCSFPISKVDDFIYGKEGVKTSTASEVEIRKGALPKNPEILVLKHAL